MTLNGGRADVEGRGDLSNREPLGTQCTETILVETSTWASETGVTAACGGDAGLDPFDEQAALELGHG
jgi:hypothetical protein